jgi:peptidyl-dipeptidase Dcp
VGLLYTDYFPRPGKRAGAWCGGFRDQERRNGAMVTPLVTNVGNFSRPTGDKPALLSPDEVRTLFHEFGHALHALLQNQTYRTPYPRTSWNFVADHENGPSGGCSAYARHYATGEASRLALRIKSLTSSSTRA